MFDLRKISRCLILAFAAASLFRPYSAHAGDRHYLLIFGAQSHPKVPRLTHTFATLVKVVDGPAGGCPCIESYTISWLPRTLKVRPYRLHDEPGRNLTLHETLHWVYANHMHASLWGPYAIESDFFHRVYREYARIESGEFRYKAIDPRQRGALTTDCIHAVTDIDGRDNRSAFSEFRGGDPATRKFVRVLLERGRLHDPQADTSWLNSALGLDCYPLRHRADP